MDKGNRSLYKNIAFTFLFWGFAQGGNSQVLFPDTIDLESVTVSYNRNISGIRPGTKVKMIDSLIFIEKTNLNLSELLSENSPIFIKTYGRGATATASFRGTGASHTQVLWNGIKINSPMSGEVDFSLIPIYFVDEVSIHFGQASMSFGSGGLGGLINISSNPDWSKKLGAKLYQSIGNYETYSSAASIIYGNSTIKGQTRVFREISQNNFAYRNTAKIGKPLEIQENADYSKFGIMQDLYYRPSTKSILSAKLFVHQVDRGIPKLMSNFSNYETNRQENQNFNAIISWQTYSEKGTWRASSGISLIKLFYQLNKSSAEGNQLPVINSHSDAFSWYNKFGYEKNLISWLFFEIQAESNIHRVSSYEDVLSSGYNGEQHQMGLRTTLTANPFKRLSVSILAGDEVYNARVTPLITSLSAEYRFLKDNSLIVKGAVSRNFHQPSLNDLNWQPGGNKNLKPEDGTTWEAGMKYSISQDQNNIYFDLSIFSSEISNWILWLPHIKGYWEPINLNRVKARGAEVMLTCNLLIKKVRIKLMSNYNYTRSTIENAGGIFSSDAHGKQLPFIPVHSGGVAINTLWNNFHLVYSFSHFSERFTTTSNNPNSVRRLYPYYMSSAAFGKDFSAFGNTMGIQLRIDNILNESYQTILWRPMPGRNYSFLIRLEI